MSNRKMPFIIHCNTLPLLLLYFLAVSGAGASDLLLQASDIMALRPKFEEFTDAGLLSPQQEILINEIQTKGTASRQEALRACATLRVDPTAPRAVRRWATFSQIHLHTMARTPLDETLPIADEWMIENPEDYENNVHLRSTLANSYVYSAGSTGCERKQLLEHLIDPLLSGPRYTVSTINAGLLYAALLQRCHNRIHGEWTTANISNYAPENRTLALEQQKLAYREAELALLKRVEALQVKLEERPSQISGYDYSPAIVESEIRQQREVLDREIEGRRRAVAGTKRTLESLEDVADSSPSVK